MSFLPTTESNSCPDFSQLSTLPEFEIGNGVRVLVVQHYGVWLVSTMGDCAMYRVKPVLEGKVMKHVNVAEYVIHHDQILSKEWSLEVCRAFPYTNMNDFMKAYMYARQIVYENDL